MIYIDDLLRYVSIATWILFVVYVTIVFVRSLFSEGPAIAMLRVVSTRVLLWMFLPVSIGLLSASIIFVDPTRVAVIISLVSPSGVRPEPMRSGLHFIIPVLESEVKYSIAWQTYTMSGSVTEGNVMGNDSIRARTSDGQEVRLDTSIIFRINPEQVVTLHIDWQERYVEAFVRPMISGLVRTQVSQFQAREVNSSARRDLEISLERILQEEFAAKGLLVDQFLIRDITFTDEYATAVEKKQVALEGLERTEYEAQQIRNLAEGERDRLSLEAEGRAAAILFEAQAQAEALRLINDLLMQNPDLLTYRYIDKLSPNIRVMLVPSETPLILPLPDLDGSVTATETLTVTAPVTTTDSLQQPGLPVPIDTSTTR